MSTNINDVINELYHELHVRFDNKPVPVSKFMKLLNKFSSPIRSARHLWKHILLSVNGYGFASNNMPVKTAGFNIFQPTDKTFPNLRIAVYSVITGGYDNIKSPIYVDDDLDYYLITDAPASAITQMGGGISLIYCLFPHTLRD